MHLHIKNTSGLLYMVFGMADLYILPRHYRMFETLSGLHGVVYLELAICTTKMKLTVKIAAFLVAEGIAALHVTNEKPVHMAISIIMVYVSILKKTMFAHLSEILNK